MAADKVVPGLDRRFPVNRALARTFSMSIDKLKASLAAAGCKLERYSERGTRIAAGELERFIATAQARATGDA